MMRVSRMQHPACLAVWFLAVLAGCGGEVSSWTAELPVVERAPRAEELFAYPEDEKSVGVNPPGFCWTPHDDADAYRLEVADAASPSRAVLVTDALASTVFPSARTLAEGDYLWQVVYLNEDGSAYGASKTRRFTVPAGIPELPMPDVGALKSRLAGVRPRMYLGGDRLEQIRHAAKSGKIRSWKFFLAAADAALEEESYQEPSGHPNGEWTIEGWRRIYTPGKVGSAHLARTALAYKITGERKYLEGARRWMMTLASWDPKGVISHDVPQPDGSEGNDEGSMPVLERMAFAWDWIGDELTAEERAKVLAVMPERGNQVLRLLHKQDFLSHPFENHEGRVLAFLGNAGLSFLGDIPEAEEWLDYVLRCYLTSFPGWGGDDGDWAQGVGYWSAYVYWLTTFAESFRGATDVDILRRPFYRNTGYLPLYFHPPYAEQGAFGDHGRGKPTEGERMLIDYLAQVFEDPYLEWHSDALQEQIELPHFSRQDKTWNEWFIEDAVSVWRAGRPEVEARPPLDLEGSRRLSRAGWAAMHSALGDPEQDVWVLFKSSPYGSFSHSHGDQNTFQLNAYGRALAIDSGYYPWYGSPHHTLWTRQTRAHNGVLVNGRGQPPFNWEAAGRIEHYEQQGPVTLVRGQAAQAYNLPPRESVVRKWEEHLKEPLPPMEPKVESFERTVAFVASKERPLLIVYDYLKTETPTTFDWLLHAYRQMAADAKSGSITIRNGDARLAVRLLATTPYGFSQFSKFPVPPGERAAGSPDQWHLTARTATPVDEIKFLAVMVSYRAEEAEPAIKTLEGKDAVGFRVGDSEVAAWWGSREQGAIDLEGLGGEGRLVLKVTEAGDTRLVVSR